MELKANIVGICTTAAKSTDNEKLWDVIPMDLIHYDKGKKGDVVICIHSDKTTIYFLCPQCGSPAPAGKHKAVFEDGIVSVKPSLDMNCCSWHGHLTNNEFK